MLSAVHLPAAPARPLEAGSRVVVILAVVTALLTPGPWPATVVVAVAAVGFVVGIPHGALDHVLAARLAGRSLLATTAGYAAVAAAAWVVLVLGGVVALGAVVALSVVHFGLGELEVHRSSGRWSHGTLGDAALAVAGTGALLLPLARLDPVTSALADTLTPGAGALLGAPVTRWALGLTWTAAATTTLVRAGRRREWPVAVDVVAVGALGAVAPPLVAFAVWFGGWHALRHTGRLLETEPWCAALLASGARGAAVARLVRLSAVPTAAALLAVAILAAITLRAPDLPAALATTVRVLLALTAPHVVVVAWMDRAGTRHKWQDRGGGGQGARRRRAGAQRQAP